MTEQEKTQRLRNRLIVRFIVVVIALVVATWRLDGWALAATLIAVYAVFAALDVIDKVLYD